MCACERPHDENSSRGRCPSTESRQPVGTGAHIRPITEDDINQAADQALAGGEHRSIDSPGTQWRRSGGSADRWDVAGGHPRFFREHLSRRSACGTSRHRYPPRDLVNSRTRDRWRNVRGPADASAHFPVQSQRQALETDARQVEVSVGCGAHTAGKVSAGNRRYSPLRKLAATRRHALPGDGRAALAATRSTKNQIILPRLATGGGEPR